MMSDRLDVYLTQLRRELSRRAAFDTRVVDEARGHLVDAIEDGLRRGLSADAAEQEALARFGTPDVVAASFARGGHYMLNRMVFVACSLTLLATGYLSLSVVVLLPPRLNYGAWILMAGLFLAQSTLTLLAVTGIWRSSLVQRWLLAGSVLLVAAGGWWVRETLSGAHFEGYALVLGTWVAIQGALTLMRLFQYDDFKVMAQPE